jgi:hypothetical protein
MTLFTFTPASLGISPANPFEKFTATDGLFPLVDPCGVLVRSDASLLTFPDAVDKNIVFEGCMENNYDAGAIVVTMFWIAKTAIAGDVVWSVEWVRQRSADAIARPYAPAKTVVSTARPVNGDIRSAMIAFTQIEADGISARNPYKIRVRRNGADGSDTMVDTAQLFMVTVEEP